MAHFTKEFKLSLIQRMMPPKNESVSSLSKETGISEVTLYKWKKQIKEKGISFSKEEIISEKWSTQEKFNIVLETSTLTEIELAKYCRERGLYVEQVKAWKDACMQANGGIAKQATELQKELRDKDHEIKKLNQELRRKDKALAETAAILVLRKKANAIWGEEEED